MSEAFWFVGSDIDGVDETQRFLDKGVWELPYDKKSEKENYINQTNSIMKDMNIGDKIAIKTTYKENNNLPFNNRGNYVPVMDIKGTGEIIEIVDEGKLKVKWNEKNPIDNKKWYFLENKSFIFKVKRDNWENEELIDFTFNGKNQDIEKFRNHPNWIDRYGTFDVIFDWIPFYEELAYKLLEYEDKREELSNIVSKTFININMTDPMSIRIDGNLEVEKDICPFTVFSVVNRNITSENKYKALKSYKKYFNLESEVPKSSRGIPRTNNMSVWFFGDKQRRNDGDINNLWSLFKLSLSMGKEFSEDGKKEFIELFNNIKDQYSIGINKLSMGLFWIMPYDFIPLDENTKKLLIRDFQSLDDEFFKNIDGEKYLELIKDVKSSINLNKYNYKNLPELSYESWNTPIINEDMTADEIKDLNSKKNTIYSKSSFLKEVFIEEEEYDTLKSLLKRKKNLILQGPPGVGKTFMAKRLAYSIMEEKDDNRIEMIQFHQNYSYEDFIMGYRPKEEGFELRNGIFYDFCEKARMDRENEYYFIIDEINRGNLSRIFGEVMMLIEDDKRGEKIRLAYSDKPFSIPENLYIIGMMNTADRSLAIIDYALRRRFVFYDLKPGFTNDKFLLSLENSGLSIKMINKIKNRMIGLNSTIAEDMNLGFGFEIGHSYFCTYNGVNEDRWYEEVVKYEIEPLLREYWFDDIEKVDNSVNELLGD